MSTRTRKHLTSRGHTDAIKRLAAKWFSEEIYNLESGEYYSCKFEQTAKQTAAKISLVLRKKRKLVMFGTACLMLIALYPATMTAIRRRLPNAAATEQKAISETVSPAPSSKLVPCPHCLPKSADEGSFGTGIDPNTDLKCAICCGKGKVLPELVNIYKLPPRADYGCPTRYFRNRGDDYSNSYDSAESLLKKINKKANDTKFSTYKDNGKHFELLSSKATESILHKKFTKEQKQLVKAYLDAHLLSRGITPPTQTASTVKRTAPRPTTNWLRNSYESCDHLCHGDRRRLTAIQASRGALPSKSSRRS